MENINFGDLKAGDTFLAQYGGVCVKTLGGYTKDTAWFGSNLLHPVNATFIESGDQWDFEDFNPVYLLAPPEDSLTFQDLNIGEAFRLNNDGGGVYIKMLLSESNNAYVAYDGEAFFPQGSQVCVDDDWRIIPLTMSFEDE